MENNLAENILIIKKYSLTKEVVHRKKESADRCGRNKHMNLRCNDLKLSIN